MLQSIYVISGGDSSYKIGISKEPMKRLNTLSLGSPRQIQMEYISFPVHNARKIEVELHKKYDACKIKEEWFCIKDLKKLINCIKSMVSESGIKEERKSEKPEDVMINAFMEKFYEELQSIENDIALEKEENYSISQFLEYIQGVYGASGKYADLIYMIVFGKTMGELQDQYGVKGKESIRDYVTADELKQIEAMEMLVSSLISCGWGYDQIKSFIQTNSMNMLAG